MKKTSPSKGYKINISSKERARAMEFLKFYDGKTGPAVINISICLTIFIWYAFASRAEYIESTKQRAATAKSKYRDFKIRTTYVEVSQKYFARSWAAWILAWTIELLLQMKFIGNNYNFLIHIFDNANGLYLLLTAHSLIYGYYSEEKNSYKSANESQSHRGISLIRIVFPGDPKAGFSYFFSLIIFFALPIILKYVDTHTLLATESGIGGTNYALNIHRQYSLSLAIFSPVMLGFCIFIRSGRTAGLAAGGMYGFLQPFIYEFGVSSGISPGISSCILSKCQPIISPLFLPTNEWANTNILTSLDATKIYFFSNHTYEATSGNYSEVVLWASLIAAFMKIILAISVFSNIEFLKIGNITYSNQRKRLLHEKIYTSARQISTPWYKIKKIRNLSAFLFIVFSLLLIFLFMQIRQLGGTETNHSLLRFSAACAILTTFYAFIQMTWSFIAKKPTTENDRLR